LKGRIAIEAQIKDPFNNNSFPYYFIFFAGIKPIRHFCGVMDVWIRLW